MSRDDPALLLDILVGARKAIEFTAGLTKDDFSKSHLHQQRETKTLENIKEAAASSMVV